MNTSYQDSPSFGFWLIAGIGLVWNAFGMVTFAQTIGMSPSAFRLLPEAEQALIAATPGWVTIVYGVAVFAGSIGCLLLMFKTAWSVAVLGISLLAVLVQMGHGIFYTNLLEVRGQSAVFLPTAIIVVAIFLFWYANKAKSQGFFAK